MSSAYWTPDKLTISKSWTKIPEGIIIPKIQWYKLAENYEDLIEQLQILTQAAESYFRNKSPDTDYAGQNDIEKTQIRQAYIDALKLVKIYGSLQTLDTLSKTLDTWTKLPYRLATEYLSSSLNPEGIWNLKKAIENCKDTFFPVGVGQKVNQIL
jgi:hypothetical protein